MAKTATRKVATAKRQGKGAKPKKPVVPMTPEVRAAAATALSVFEERLMDHEGLGFISASTRELKGGKGMQKTVRFENGEGARNRATVSVRYR